MLSWLPSTVVWCTQENQTVMWGYYLWTSSLSPSNPTYWSNQPNVLGHGSSSLYTRIKDFLTNSLQVRISQYTSSFLILNKATPHGCVLSRVLFTLFTHDCTPIYTSISKFAVDTTVVGLLWGNKENAYRLQNCCVHNNLIFQTSGNL